MIHISIFKLTKIPVQPKIQCCQSYIKKPEPFIDDPITDILPSGARKT
jgi:hypothetical protein